ncbi:nuclear transport factor 2 family protein [Deinococcus sp. KNUC1210]|uniref:nuclear transport factor 2 family protein n=1 Tax=Deinococcus sp. KNUC1210 TaxID=2917691 RepID=UPI001EEF964E|nr:nuclear transport factor 2 family protein [Deinococcus sp. KNUC1210]ULH14662.1 nuclear transport factor 2 family protein [Deinococcus sp. KNUC1210]
MTAGIKTAEALVRGQLEAYNARDLETFVSFFDDDIEAFLMPGQLLYQGKDELRQRHAVRFQEPDLYAELLHRRVIGDFVIDQEAVTRNFPEGRGQFDVAATYQIENGNIRRMWYVMGTPRIEAGED